MVVANCGGSNLVLGPATSYQVYQNVSLLATIVDLRNGTQRRVLLLSWPGSKPMIEDIGGALELQSGPVAVTSLDIDFSHFATDGVVNISDGSATPTTTTVRVGDHISRERSLLSAAAAGN